ncbi:hypothetical protein FHT02_003662 [Sphingomonas xinjiangensis]|uniref:Uncharacterized protein n=1 Tax=Sphingomonas xinjiangensis TaxID=643568 RepID=A0A840YRV0_9SPHN|nr:hypothetical protein [Sphingomonas xinjiangensis]
MQTITVLMLLPFLGYCLVQTYRDVRRHNWFIAAWGGALIVFLGWLIEALTRGPSY